MLWTNTKRIARSGFFNFWRNSFVSITTVLVLSITLFAIGSIIFLGALLNATLEEIKNQVDINVYFSSTAPEGEILALQEALEALPEVGSVEYLSREEVLRAFRERHAGNEVTIQALRELGDEANPFGAVLNIRADEPSQYEGIAAFLEQRESSLSGPSIINSITFHRNREAIENLSKVISAAERLGFGLSLVLVVVASLIAFNTIRLTIYMSKEEISVMGLVGASAPYIRGPFVVVGIMYGIFSGIITLALFYPATYWLGGVTQDFFIGMNVFHYYLSNFGEIFLIIIGSGVFIGALSSYLAVKKYLRV